MTGKMTNMINDIEIRKYALPKEDAAERTKIIPVDYNGNYEYVLAHQITDDKGKIVEVLALTLKSHDEILNLPDVKDPKEKYFYLNTKDQKFDEKTRGLIKNKINLEYQLKGEVKFL